MDGSTFVILKSLLNRAEGDVSDILALLGTTDISSIGDGTVTGAIDDLKDLIDLLPKFDIEVVQTLPTSDISETTIYLVPAQKTGSRDLYSEYIYVNNTWELLGVQRVDLDNYYTKSEVNALTKRCYVLKFAITINNDDSQTITSYGISEKYYNGRFISERIIYNITDVTDYEETKEAYSYIVENILATSKNISAELDIYIPDTGNGYMIETPVVFSYVDSYDEPDSRNHISVYFTNSQQIDGYVELVSTGPVNSFIVYPSKINTLTATVGDISNALDTINGEVV